MGSQVTISTVTMRKGWKGDPTDLWGGPIKPSKDHYFQREPDPPTLPTNWVQNGKIAMSVINDALTGLDQSHQVYNEPHPSTSADRYFEETNRKASVDKKIPIDKQKPSSSKSDPKWPTFTKEDIIAMEEKLQRNPEIDRNTSQVYKPGYERGDPGASSNNDRQTRFNQMSRIVSEMPEEEVKQLVSNIHQDARNNNLSFTEYVHRRANNLPLDASITFETPNTPVKIQNMITYFWECGYLQHCLMIT